MMYMRITIQRKNPESVLDSSRGSYTGIGATLAQDGQSGTITVNDVYENTPASEAGLQVGDELLAIDDTALTDVQLSDLVSMIKSEDGDFSITVYRPSDKKEVILPIMLGDVELQKVSYEMKQNGIGYIKMEEFTETAVDQFCEAAEALEAQNMQALIVDLRDNPGGLLTSVCDILDEVLPEKLLVYTEDKNGGREEYSQTESRIVDCEIAVLVNFGGSASASEIFAGAMQDYERGPVIGTKTYGKGIVQRTFPLRDGSAFKMTVEKYYTPNGQDINGNGITPDIIVEDPKDGTESGKTPESAGRWDRSGAGKSAGGISRRFERRISIPPLSVRESTKRRGRSDSVADRTRRRYMENRYVFRGSL